jgi:hypothetical protein
MIDSLVRQYAGETVSSPAGRDKTMSSLMGFGRMEKRGMERDEDQKDARKQNTPER